ncbi:E-selectin-like isoform X2 [Glandiceps talaboti]
MKPLHTWLWLLIVMCLLLPSVNGWRRRRRHVEPHVDTVKPIFTTCPTSFSEIASPRSYTKRVTYPAPKATDESGEPTVEHISGVSSGTNLYGKSDIEYTATDGSGNKAPCTFTITVTGAYRSCRSSGSWSGSQPVCNRVTCQPTLGDIAHGTVKCTNSNYQNSICYHTCYKGYSITGGFSVVVCMGSSGATGQWSSDQPTCVDTEPPAFITCPESIKMYADEGSTDIVVDWEQPEANDNSGETVTSELAEGIPPGSTFDQGYHVIKYTSTDGAGNVGTCMFTILGKVVTCTYPQLRPKLLVDCPSGFVLGSECRFACDDGYELVGNDKTTCNGTGDPPKGEWTNPTPSCEPVTCPVLNPPDNGKVMTNTMCGNTYNDWCYFECDLGYRLVGSNARRCTATQIWDGLEPTCQGTIAFQIDNWLLNEIYLTFMKANERFASLIIGHLLISRIPSLHSSVLHSVHGSPEYQLIFLIFREVARCRGGERDIFVIS